MDEEKIKSKCLKRWAVNDYKDDKLSYFDENLRNWLFQMSTELQEIVSELLNKFEYYSKQRINLVFIELHEKLLKLETISFENTIYIPLKGKNGKLNSSYEYLINYRSVNEINGNIVYNDINSIRKDIIELIENIVFVDDCSGSGKTFINYLETVKDKVKNKRIIFVVVHIMESAINCINEYKEKNELNIQIICFKRVNKAFFCSLENEKHIFEEESESRKIKKELVFGFKKTEGLMAFYNNTPNNTLGLFWFDSEGNKPIFPRANYPKPHYLISQKKKEVRKKVNYLNRMESK